jgi:hypothetical protein
MEVDIQQWFFKHYRVLYKVASSPIKPRSFIENGIRYLNQFPDFMHSKSRSFKDFDEKVRNIVMRKILRHIHKVWCSAKKELTEYVIDWLAHMINGEKVPTALYLKSLPGTGKSIICEFILNKVLGPQMVYKTSDPDQVAGKFNSAIAGKLLLYLEEMPKKSNLEWTAIADRFKALIDPGRIDINEKGKPSYNTDNTASIIVNTNRNAVRIDTTDRRWVFLDISDEHVGNHEYFDELGECIEEPEVGEAFFAYMCERARAKPDWVTKQAKKIPRTDTKQEQIVRNLDNLYVFIKEHYISHQSGLDIPQTEFYKRYSFVYENRAHDKYTVGSMMASLGFKRGSKYLKQKRVDGTRPFCYVMSYDELYALFDKKGWIHSRDREDYGIDNESEELSTPISKPESVSQPEPEKIAPPVSDSSNPSNKELDIKKPSLSITMDDLLDELQNYIEDIKEIDPASIPLPESPKLEAVVVEPIPEPEPHGIPGPSNIPATKPVVTLKKKPDALIKLESKENRTKSEEKKYQALHLEWILSGVDKLESSKPITKSSEPNVYMDDKIEALFQSAKNLCEEDGYDPEEFDGESLAIEIEDLSNHKVYDLKADPYHYSLNRAVQIYRDKSNRGTNNMYTYPPNEVIAQKIRKYYKEERGIIRVSPPEGYKTVPIKKLKAVPNIDEKELAQAMGYDEECSDDDAKNINDDDADEDWYESLKNI